MTAAPQGDCAALEAAGVIFLDDGQSIDGGLGVRLALKAKPR